MKEFKLIAGDTLIFILLLCLIGCKTQIKYVPVEKTTTITETVRDTVIDVQIEYVRDSANVDLSVDSASFLSNDYAFSNAYVRDGILYHDLSTWPGKRIAVTVPQINRVVTINNPTPYPVEVEVNKLFWWQKVLMWVGLISLFAFVIFILIKFRNK